MITVAVSGCTAAGETVGTFTVNLTGRGDSGAVYRLRDAVITVQGPTSTQVWNTEDDPSRTSLSADVEVGDYSALLHDGWRIERLDDAAAVTVPAALISDNPTRFTVTALQRTSVPLQFRIDGDTVDLSQGYDLTIGVQEASLLAIANAEDRFPAGVEVFPAGASGNAAPFRLITGPSTQLTVPGGLAVAGGELVVANQDPPTINVYPVTADGNFAPIRQITGVTSTTGSGPFGVVVSEGEIYARVGRDIDVFPLGAAGQVAPTRALQNLAGLGRFAVDHGELYALQFSSLGGIAVYPATATATQPPTRIIVMPESVLCPVGIAIHGGLVYVTDSCTV